VVSPQSGTQRCSLWGFWNRHCFPLFFARFFHAHSCAVSNLGHLQDLPLIAPCICRSDDHLPNSLRRLSELRPPRCPSLAVFTFHRAQVFHEENLGAIPSRNPADAVAQHDLGRTGGGWRSKEHSPSRGSFETSMRNDPENADALDNLGHALDMQGRFPEAVNICWPHFRPQAGSRTRTRTWRASIQLGRETGSYHAP